MIPLNWAEAIPSARLLFLNEAHKLCRRNKAAITASQFCGCFNCLAFFTPVEVKRFVRKARGEAIANTALCPRCEMDSVIPDSELAADSFTLRRLRTFWFAAPHLDAPGIDDLIPVLDRIHAGDEEARALLDKTWPTDKARQQQLLLLGEGVYAGPPAPKTFFVHHKAEEAPPMSKLLTESPSVWGEPPASIKKKTRKRAKKKVK